MARTTEQILREMLGGQALTIAQQTAMLESARERIAALEAELAALQVKAQG